MKTLIVTVAGMATRFSETVGKPCLKCVYFRESFEESLLSRLIHLNDLGFDNFIIVGGFMYDELKSIIGKYLSDFIDRIILLQNEHFSDYGSGYSLYLGLKKAVSIGSTEIVFAEGDLYVDRDGFYKICSSNKDVITTNNEPILAATSVAFYFDKAKKIHYIFDANHKELEISEPFTEIRNSGQVWKFMDIRKMSKILNNLTEIEKRGTNLNIIQKYYETLERGEFDIINFQHWINCNTIDDFNAIDKMGGKQ